jgi:hypothetical protein
MKKTATLIGAAVAALAIATAAPASAAQGGHDGDHWWLKIANAEFRQNGNWAYHPCVNALEATSDPRSSADACNHLAFFTGSEFDRNPHANGYWAEYYSNGAHRSGTW